MDNYNYQQLNNMPYKGLMPYSESKKDALSFFGRKAQQETIKRNLRNSRLTLLFGESGVGKSSVLRAGVVYNLREEAKRNLVECGTPKFAVVMFPSVEGNRSWQDDPLTELLEQVEEDIQNIGLDVLAPEVELSFAEKLLVWTRRISGNYLAGELFIILDQFEEYFLYHPEEDSLAAELAQVLNRSNLRVNILISIREDSLGNLERFRGYIPNLFDNILRIEHLDTKSAFEAIEKPITEYYNDQVPPENTVEVEPALIEEVLLQISQSQKDLKATNGRGGLDKQKSQSKTRIEAPYLQLVMTRIWEKEMQRNSRCLRLETLTQLGDVHKIFKEHLTGAMRSLSPDEKDIAARIFQYLVTPSGAKITYPILELAKPEKVDINQLAMLLEKLSSSKQRIIRPVGQLPNQALENKRYEIFHDVLAQPILDWRRQYLDRKQRQQERQLQQQQLQEEQKQRILLIKKGLPAQSLRQQRRRQDELAALLARQSYLFNQRDKLQVLDQVDDTLRQALSVANFSNILQWNGAIRSVAWSPNGQTLAAGGLDGAILLWNLLYHTEPKIITVNHNQPVNSIAFSPNGEILASGSDDGNIKIWDLSQDKIVSQDLGSHKGNVWTVAFSPNGQILASGSDDGNIKLWDLKQPLAEAQVLTGHAKGVRTLSFSPTSQILASSSDDLTIRLWDLEETATPPIVRYGHEDIIRAVTFSPDGEILASASDDRTIKIWDLREPKEVPKTIQGHEEKVRTVAFSPDGKILASGSDDQTIRLWDTHELNRPPTILRGHYFDILSLAFSPNSQILASSSGDNTVRLWDLRAPIANPKILQRHKEKVHAVVFSPDGQMLASGSSDKTVRLWNLNQNNAEPQILKHGGQVFAVAFFFGKDNQVQILASGSTDNKVRLWNLQKPLAEPQELLGHNDGISSVAFSPDGLMLASGSWDTTIRLWNLQQIDANPIVLEGHTQSVTSVAFSPDGEILASASDDNTIRLWKLSQLEAKPIVLRDHNGRVWSVAFSPDGKTLASGSDDWTVRLWDIKQLDGKPINPIILGRHNTWVASVAFSPNGKMLASGSYDRSIKLWNLNQLEEQPIVLTNHNQSLTSVAFSPDGKLLASGSYDGTVRLWIVDTETLAQSVCEKVLRNLTSHEWQQFMGNDIPYEATCPNLVPGTIGL